MKRFDRAQRPAILATLAAVSLSAASTMAADFNAVTILPDHGLTDSTNIHGVPIDTRTLCVTFNTDVAKGTNTRCTC